MGAEVDVRNGLIYAQVPGRGAWPEGRSIWTSSPWAPP